MTLKYDITDAEYAEYVKNVYKNSWSFKKNGWKYLAFIVVIIGINIYNSAIKKQESEDTSSYFALILSWLILLAILVVFWFATRWFLSKNVRFVLKPWMYAIIGIGLFSGYLYSSRSLSPQDGEENTNSLADSLLSWAFLMFLLGCVWVYFISLFASAKRLKPEDRETILGDREMTFDDDRLTSKNKMTESVFRWEAIKKWEQTTNIYLLFITDNSAFIVPKRVFENGEEQAKFEQLIKRKLPDLTSERYLDA
jgi:hypothetical protein